MNLMHANMSITDGIYACPGNLVHPCYVRKGGMAFPGWEQVSRLFWLVLTHGLKWNTTKKVAVPAKNLQIGPILVPAQSKKV